MRRLDSTIIQLATLLLGVCIIQEAVAQAFPSKPIRVIIPVAPGGVNSALMRLLGAQITESTGQPVIVENRPSAGGIVGLLACAKAAPDGYTVCSTSQGPIAYDPHLTPDLPYDVETDFAPVANLGFTNGMIVAHGKAPVSSYKEMIAYAKAKPGALNWGTWGRASVPDLYLEWIKRHEGVNITAIPYKGLLPANTALYAGEIDFTYLGIGTALQQIKAGKVKPIAVLGDRRSPLLPDIPSLAEEGSDPRLPGYLGLFAPGKTPKALLDRLNTEFVQAARKPRLQEFYRSSTIDPAYSSAAEFAEFVKANRANAGKIFRILKLEK